MVSKDSIYSIPYKALYGVSCLGYKVVLSLAARLIQHFVSIAI